MLKGNKKSVKDASETEYDLNNADIEAQKKETKLKKELGNFERDYRREFEKNLSQQMKALESLQRGEIPVTNSKNKKIAFVVIDTGLKIPIYVYEFNVDPNFNSLAFSLVIDELIENYFKSKQFLETQKRIYYRLKQQGIKENEIYHIIEPRYSQMDSNEKKKFRNNLARWYGRKISQKKGDKSDEVSPRSES